MKELGEAINGSLAESEQIAQAITRIKDEGFDVFLVLEATIGFNKHDDETAAPELVSTRKKKRRTRVQRQCPRPEVPQVAAHQH
jgi:hypothetical protein